MQEIVQVSGVDSCPRMLPPNYVPERKYLFEKDKIVGQKLAAPDQQRGSAVALWHSSDVINEWHVCPHHYALSTRLVQHRTKHFHSLVSQFCTKQNNKNAKIRLVFFSLYIRFLISR